MIEPRKKRRPKKRRRGKVGRPKNAPKPEKTLGVELKTARALELAQEGWSYAAIAETLTAELGAQYGTTSKTRAFQLVKEALDEAVEARKAEAERIIALELMRLNEMTIGVFPMAKGGNTLAVTAMLSIMDRRARYLGINAPTKTVSEVTGKDGGPIQSEVALTDAAASFDAKAEKVIADAIAARVAGNDPAAAQPEADDSGRGVGPGDERGGASLPDEPDAS